MKAIYHTNVTLKGGPLNILQSNFAFGTVHCILYLTICLALFAFPSVKCWKAEKRTKLTPHFFFFFTLELGTDCLKRKKYTLQWSGFLVKKTTTQHLRYLKVRQRLQHVFVCQCSFCRRKLLDWRTQTLAHSLKYDGTLYSTLYYQVFLNQTHMM